jgi:hypothetical protein
VRVDTGYFLLDAPDGQPLGLRSLIGSFSAASMASGLSLAGGEDFAWRDGRLIPQRWAKRRRAFELEGRRFDGISTGGSEHFGLPRAFPALSEVNVYLGWFSPFSRAAQAAALLGSAIARRPAARGALQRLVSGVRGSRGGPAVTQRSSIRSLTAGLAYDAGGKELARSLLEGPELYTITAQLLAWGAKRAAAGALRGAGALGPIEALGIHSLRDGCAAAGVEEAD